MSEADRLNQDETRRVVATPMRGVRPIRKRGIHRARKRCELWILREDALLNMANEMLSEMLVPTDSSSPTPPLRYMSLGEALEKEAIKPGESLKCTE